MRFGTLAATSALTTILWTTVAEAHPGHGSTEPESPVHYLVEPQHAWWIFPALVVSVGIVAWTRSRRRAEQKVPVLRRQETDSHRRQP